ncbi:MFS transporter [Bacillus sp. B1-b2]|uniref:MFS transporter n=1 Tax=Bacillus sp. B1-b2 TaxID=2653201 RepID=UPI001261E2EE|nr:MFS transporter [Bacillus sp. B1-b2]KAB7673189.1 MFS transporter [Bacillus sp. B1-b2]
MQKEALWTRGFIQIWVSNFFLFLTFYYLLVSLPVFALRELEAKQSSSGLIVTVFLITAIIIRPIAGNIMQKIGTKNLFVISLIIFLGASLFYPITHSLGGLLLVRAIHGIGFGMATTATGTIVADLLPQTRRGEGMGYYSMSMNLAMVIGPFLGLQAINTWGSTILFILAMVFACMALILGVLITIPKSNVQEKLQVEQNKGPQMNQLLEKTAVKISLVAALFGIVYSSILSFVSVYAENKGLVSVSGYFFVVYAIVMLLARPFAGRWFDKYGANVIIYPCIILFAVGMIILSMVQSPWMFLLAAALIGLGYGTMFPCLQTIAIQKAAPQRRGLATATFLSLFDMGIGFGSFIVGIIGGAIGFDSFYFFSSFYILICLGVYYVMHGRVSKIKQNVVNTNSLNS